MVAGAEHPPCGVAYWPVVGLDGVPVSRRLVAGWLAGREISSPVTVHLGDNAHMTGVGRVLSIPARARTWMARTGAGFYLINFVLLPLLAAAVVVMAALWDTSRISAFITVAVALVVMSVALWMWRSARWVRLEVSARRALGRTVWPVRAETSDHPNFFAGVLETGPDAFSVTIRLGTVRVRWEDVESVTLSNRGLWKGDWIVIETSSQGKVDLEVLEPNATAKMDLEGYRDCVNTLKGHLAAGRGRAQSAS